MASLDLDARRAARSETLQEPHKVTFGGEVFTFPPMPPMEALELLDQFKVREGFLLLLGEEEGRRFLEHRPDMVDLGEIVEELYATTMGELLASFNSSPTTTERSRPTSNGSTRSSSPAPAGARKRSARVGS